MAACGLNFPDVLQCRGRYHDKAPHPVSPGLEVVGTIVAPNSLPVGQRVIAMPLPPDDTDPRCLGWVGMACVQIAQAAGLRVIATVRGAAKAAAVESLGAGLVVTRPRPICLASHELHSGTGRRRHHRPHRRLFNPPHRNSQRDAHLACTSGLERDTSDATRRVGTNPDTFDVTACFKWRPVEARLVTKACQSSMVSTSRRMRSSTSSLA